MKPRDEVVLRLFETRRRRDVLKTYRGEAIRIEDHHGVQDVSSDLREVETEVKALEWVLE